MGKTLQQEVIDVVGRLTSRELAATSAAATWAAAGDTRLPNTLRRVLSNWQVDVTRRYATALLDLVDAVAGEAICLLPLVRGVAEDEESERVHLVLAVYAVLRVDAGDDFWDHYNMDGIGETSYALYDDAIRAGVETVNGVVASLVAAGFEAVRIARDETCGLLAAETVDELAQKMIGYYAWAATTDDGGVIEFRVCETPMTGIEWAAQPYQDGDIVVTGDSTVRSLAPQIHQGV
jgi:hypothetical protein